MNPWYLAAILAGGVAVASLAGSAAAQAKAAMPKVTAFAVVILPTQGLNGQWDLWVTGLDGQSGQPMLGRIPGHQMIYIPAALAQSQPTTSDWTYTFTPKGTTQSFTIIVPAAILQAYQKSPKTEFVKRTLGAYIASRNIRSDLLAQPAPTSSATCATDVNTVMNTAKSIINSFPADGSDATAYITWGITTAAQVPGVINDLNTLVTCIQNGTAAGDIGALQALISQLMPLVAKAAAQAAKGSDQPGDMPTDQPSDQPTTTTDQPSDQ